MQQFPNVTVLDTQFNDNDANKASAQLQAVFARNDDLAGVFGANLFSAIGAADGVKALGKSGAIRVVAFDTPTRIVDDLKSGLVDFAVAQHPAEIGYYGVMTAYAVINGQSVPPEIGTGCHHHDQGRISTIRDREVRLLGLSAAGPARPGPLPLAGRDLTGSSALRQAGGRQQEPPSRPPLPRRARGASAIRRWPSWPPPGPGCSCVLLLIFFESWARLAYGVSFLVNPYNLQSIAHFAALPLLLGLGQTFVIIAGGIDLSVGFVMGLAAVVMARMMQTSRPIDPGWRCPSGFSCAFLAALVPG